MVIKMNKTTWKYWLKLNQIWYHYVNNPLYDLKWNIKIWYQQTFHPTEQEIWEKMMAKTFPELYKHRAKRSPFECAGFAIGKGWRQLIFNLSDDIDTYCFCYDVKYPTILQVKEKFGGLRFYIGGGDEYINGLVSKAEKASFEICEYCGSRDDVKQTGNWIKTLCWVCRGETKDIQMNPSSPEAIIYTTEDNK